MKMQPVSADLVIKLALGAAAVFGVYYVTKKIANSAGNLVHDTWAAGVDSVQNAAQYVNPVSDKNILYQTASLPVGLTTGDTLGTAIYGGVQYIASPENDIYRAANTLTGGDNDTSSIGTRIYDFFHPGG